MNTSTSRHIYSSSCQSLILQFAVWFALYIKRLMWVWPVRPVVGALPLYNALASRHLVLISRHCDEAKTSTSRVLFKANLHLSDPFRPGHSSGCSRILYKSLSRPRFQSTTNTLPFEGDSCRHNLPCHGAVPLFFLSF